MYKLSIILIINEKLLIKNCIPSKLGFFHCVYNHVIALSLSIDNHINDNSMHVTSTIISLITKLLLMCQHFVIFYSIVKKKSREKTEISLHV